MPDTSNPSERMQYAHKVSKSTRCKRRSVGAVLTLGNKVIATGSNGAPLGCGACKTCMRKEMNVAPGERMDLCRAIHAEVDCLVMALRNYKVLDYAIMYVTTKPCSNCAKMIIHSGIRKVYYKEEYPDEMTDRLFAEAGAELIQIDAYEMASKLTKESVKEISDEQTKVLGRPKAYDKWEG